MRTLRPKQNEDLVPEDREFILQSEIDGLTRRIEEVQDELDLSEAELDAYKADNQAAFSTGTFTATDVTTEDLHAQDADIQSLQASTIESVNIENTNKIQTDTFEANSASIEALSAANLIAEEATISGKLTVEELEVENHVVDNEVIGSATIGSADITDLTSNVANIDSLSAGVISTSEISTGILETGLAKATDVETENLLTENATITDTLTHDKNNYGNTYVRSYTPVWIELPIVNTGRYLLQVYNTDLSEWYFGVNISFAGNDNATIQYSEASWEEEPQFLGNDVYLYEGHLYFECRQPTSTLLWRFETAQTNASDSFDAPRTSGVLPFDPSNPLVERFKIKNAKGTIFTRWVQIGEDGSTGVLTLSPTSWLEAGDVSVQYDTLNDVSFGFYAPDQDLDKGSSPEFHTIKLDTEGKTVVRATDEGVVYTQEEASVDNGTLVPEPKLIEADDLYEYNGNSYDIVTQVTPGDWILFPGEANPMKAVTTEDNVNGYFWHFENEGGWTEVTNNRLFESSEYRQGFAWPSNNSTGLLGVDLSKYTLDGTEEVPSYGEYKLQAGDRFAIKICSDVWNSASCTRTYKLDPSVRGSAISETYAGDWFAHSTSKNYLMKNIYASGDTRNAVSTFTDGNSETGLNLNFTNAFNLVNGFYNKLAGTSNLNNFCIIKQGNNYFITKSRSASWSFTEKTVSCFNGVYTSLNAAINAFFNQTYSGTQSVTLTSNVDWFYPMLLGEACSVGSGEVHTALTAYRYKKVVQQNIKRFTDDTDTPLDSHFDNTSANNNYYIQRNDGKWANIISINTSYNTTVTIAEPYGISSNTLNGPITTVYSRFVYSSDGTYAFGAYDPDVLTPPATLNKLYEVIKVPKGEVEYGAVTETVIDYTSTGHPIKNLGDGTIVYGTATIGTNLTVNRDTVLGNDEGVLDPDTGDPIETNVTVKGTSSFKKEVQIGDANASANLKVRGGIYRYNSTLQDYEEIDDTYQRVEEKGQPDGYAPLDINARIPRNYMPYDVMEYRGSWDASTGVFPQGTAQDPLQVGDTYKVSVAGTIDGQYYGVNDEITYNGATWDYYENNKVILGTTDLGVVGCMWLG